MAQISLINIKESGRRINKIRIACDTVAAAKAAFKSVQSGISKLRWGKGERKEEKRNFEFIF